MRGSSTQIILMSKNYNFWEKWIGRRKVMNVLPLIKSESQIKKKTRSGLQQQQKSVPKCHWLRFSCDLHTHYHGRMIKMLTRRVFCYWLIRFPQSIILRSGWWLDFVLCCTFYCLVLCLPPGRWWTNVCWGKQHTSTTAVLGNYSNKENVPVTKGRHIHKTRWILHLLRLGTWSSRKL